MSVSAASQWFPARRRQLLFALRATTAAFTGYVLALALHLECPYWAAHDRSDRHSTDTWTAV